MAFHSKVILLVSNNVKLLPTDMEILQGITFVKKVLQYVFLDKKITVSWIFSRVTYLFLLEIKIHPEKLNFAFLAKGLSQLDGLES